MGYTNYICQIKWELYDREKLKDYEYRNNNTEVLIELGKYIDFTDKIVFEEKADIDEDGEYYRIDKKQLLTIVQIYAEKHLKFLERIKSGEPEYPFEKMMTADEYIDEQVKLWKNPNMIYNTDIYRKHIVDSWYYEYEIFELLHIYKTFDSSRYYMLWTGH